MRKGSKPSKDGKRSPRADRGKAKTGAEDKHKQKDSHAIAKKHHIKPLKARTEQTAAGLNAKLGCANRVVEELLLDVTFKWESGRGDRVLAAANKSSGLLECHGSGLDRREQ